MDSVTELHLGGKCISRSLIPKSCNYFIEPENIGEVLSSKHILLIVSFLPNGTMNKYVPTCFEGEKK